MENSINRGEFHQQGTGQLQSTASQRIRLDWSDWAYTHIMYKTHRKGRFLLDRVEMWLIETAPGMILAGGQGTWEMVGFQEETNQRAFGGNNLKSQSTTTELWLSAPRSFGFSSDHMEELVPLRFKCIPLSPDAIFPFPRRPSDNWLSLSPPELSTDKSHQNLHILRSPSF